MRQAVTRVALALCAAAVCVSAVALSASEQQALHALQQQTWDQATFKEVHPAIAYLALKQLSPRASAAVKALLPGTTLLAEAGWADRITFTEPKQTWSSPLHFINLPTNACAYVRSRDCKSNSGEANVCVDGAIQNYTARLANAQLPLAQRTEALKFVTHFVGDIHQPLHVANGADWGGNKLTGTFVGAAAPSNLHAIWDAAIAQKRVTDDFGGNAHNWADSTMRRVRATDKAQWTKCRNARALYGACSDEWANESAQLACDYAYKLSDGKTPIPAAAFALDKVWYERNIEIVERQVVKAAVRLAAVLNKVFANGLTTAPAAPGAAKAPALPPKNARNTGRQNASNKPARR